LEHINLIKVPAKYRYTAWPNIVANSGHWFSKNAMRWFNSRISWGTLRAMAGDNYTFISSEQSPNGVRRYSVREYYSDGTIQTLGEFDGYVSRSAALRAQAKFHREEEEYVASFN